MKKNAVIIIIAYLFIALFIYTSVSKIAGFDTYLHDLRRSPLLGPFALFISIAIPASELGVSALLANPKTRERGFIGAFTLMLLFTLYVGYVLTFRTERPCTCGGIIRELSWPNHMIFNLLFLLLSLVGILIQRRKFTNNYA